MKFIADTHCHTVASTHAYSTAMEMITAAAKKGLYAIALTDHGRSMPGAPGTWFFENLKTIPKKVEGVRVLRGIEANVIDFDGTLDTDESVFRGLDWVIASMHGAVLQDGISVEGCTNAWLNIAKNPYVHVIGHSGMQMFQFDYETVIPEFGRCGKLVEINAHSFEVRKDAIPNCKIIAKLCKKYGVQIVVNSDAHFCTEVGNLDDAVRMLKELDFPEELVLNANKERFKRYLKEHTHVFD